MLIFKKTFSLSSSEQTDIKNFVSKTIESMLKTKEDTINIQKNFDLVFVSSLEGNYLVIDIYQLSKFTLYDKKNTRRHNIPYYSAARSLNRNEAVIVYIDDHKEKGLGIKNLQAFYYICSLIAELDIEVLSPEKYKCVW